MSDKSKNHASRQEEGMSIASRIRERIRESYHGKVFITASLLDLGSRSAVDQSLKRMVSKGEIKRLAPGVFVSRIEAQSEITPNADQIAFAIAEQEGLKIQITGEEAAFRLGFIPIIPTRPVYDTAGINRLINVDGYTIYFKSVSAKKLFLAGSKAGIALSALSYIGRGNITDQTLYAVERKIGRDQYIKLMDSIHLMPGWLAKEIRHIIKTRIS